MIPATVEIFEADKKDARALNGLEAAMGMKARGESKDGRFEFDLSDCDVPDFSRKVIRSVRFPISRGEAYTCTIEFEPATAQLGALAAARAYLDQPIERAYYDAIADDLTDLPSWGTLVAEGLTRRGHLLADLVRYKGFEAREGLEGAYDLLLET